MDFLIYLLQSDEFYLGLCIWSMPAMPAWLLYLQWITEGRPSFHNFFFVQVKD